MKSTLDQITSSMDLDFDTILGKPKQTGLDQFFWNQINLVFFEGISLSILAIVAGVLILAGWVPQIIKGYRTKKLDDVSKYLMILLASGAFLWILYGIEKDDPFIIGVNVAAIVLTMIVLAMKFKYSKRTKIDA